MSGWLLWSARSLRSSSSGLITVTAPLPGPVPVPSDPVKVRSPRPGTRTGRTTAAARLATAIPRAPSRPMLHVVEPLPPPREPAPRTRPHAWTRSTESTPTSTRKPAAAKRKSVQSSPSGSTAAGTQYVARSGRAAAAGRRGGAARAGARGPPECHGDDVDGEAHQAEPRGGHEDHARGVRHGRGGPVHDDD